MNAPHADPPRSRAIVADRVETIDSSRMIVRSIIATATPDRANDVVVPDGLGNAEEFLKNPVVLWAHQRTLPPIGICRSLEVHADRIIAVTQFSATLPFARDVFRLYDEGILRGWSIGFVPKRSHPRPRRGMVVEEWELLEYSAVPIPENPRALTLAIRKGLMESPEWPGILQHCDILANLFEKPISLCA